MGFPENTGAAEVNRELWVEVRINEVSRPEVALLRIDSQGRLFVRASDVKAWRMSLPAGSLHPSDSDSFIRIDNVTGLRARLDRAESRLDLEAAPSLFAAQLIRAGRPVAPPERGIPALFLDYSLFGEHVSGAGETYSGLFQAGSSLGRASFTTSWLGSRQTAAPESSLTGSSGQSSWHRLDTALLFDWPEYTARLTFGDSTTLPGTLGQAVRFSGIHWGTDFSTQPGMAPFALPIVSGTATLPSSVELYVNQALVQRTMVDAGPFQLNNIPVPVGQGAVDIRLRDILGNVQQLSVPYLVSPSLLPSGFTATDFEVGAVREDYGIENFSYGTPFLMASMRHGWSGALTLNTSAEVRPKEYTIRGGGAIRVTRNITAELAPAFSDSPSGTGAAVDSGINSLWGPTSFGIHFRSASAHFTELGTLPPATQLHTEWAAQTSTQISRWGSLGLIYARRKSYDAPTTAATTLTYNVSMRELGSVGAFFSQTRSGTSDVIFGVTYTRYLGRGSTASITTTTDSGASTTDMRVGRPAPPDSGWGWELAHARGGTNTDGLRLEARSAYGVGSGEFDTTPAGNLAMLAWQGGLLWTGSRPWPAQTLGGPAALVELADLRDVEVFHDGQPVGRTDSQGRILVPALRPFEDNFITIKSEDLPLTALVESEKLTVRPYSHGVVRAAFPVAALESQTFFLRLEHGSAVPVGAELTLNGHTFPVGTQGIAQIPVLHAAADATASWPGGRCRVHLPAMKHASDLGIHAECKRMP